MQFLSFDWLKGHGIGTENKRIELIIFLNLKAAVLSSEICAAVIKERAGCIHCLCAVNVCTLKQR